MPDKLDSLSTVLTSDNMVHCIGRRNVDQRVTDFHFSIKLRELYLKNGALIIFTNWLRFYGFESYAKDIGTIVEKYAGYLR